MVAPAGVEPTMGESKSPALPLGDGAISFIFLVVELSGRLIGHLIISDLTGIMRAFKRLLCYFN